MWVLIGDKSSIWRHEGSVSRKPELKPVLAEWLRLAYPDQWTTVNTSKRGKLISRNMRVLRAFKLRWEDTPETTFRAIDTSAFYAPYIPLQMVSANHLPPPKFLTRYDYSYTSPTSPLKPDNS